jgi:hypothetical protein
MSLRNLTMRFQLVKITRASKNKNSLPTCMYQSDTVNPKLTSRVRTHLLSFFSSPARLSINKHHNSSIIFDRRSIVSQWHNKLFYQHRRSHCPYPPYGGLGSMLCGCCDSFVSMIQNHRGVCFKSMIVALVYFMARGC